MIDPAVIDTGKTGIQQAWGRYIPERKALRYRHECLRTALPAELARARAHRADKNDGSDGPSRSSPSESPSAISVGPLCDVLVVACHACQHLTDEVCTIAAAFGTQSTGPSRHGARCLTGVGMPYDRRARGSDAVLPQRPQWHVEGRRQDAEREYSLALL